VFLALKVLRSEVVFSLQVLNPVGCLSLEVLKIRDPGYYGVVSVQVELLPAEVLMEMF
jgi:hypothetical protein